MIQPPGFDEPVRIDEYLGVEQVEPPTAVETVTDFLLGGGTSRAEAEAAVGNDPVQFPDASPVPTPVIEAPATPTPPPERPVSETLPSNVEVLDETGEVSEPARGVS